MTALSMNTRRETELKNSTDYSKAYKNIFFEILPIVAPCNTWLFNDYQQEEKPLEETVDFLNNNLDHNLKSFWEIAYFRKANFVYAYFKDKLEDECCFVTREDVQDLADRCKRIIDTDIRQFKLKEELSKLDNQIEISTNMLVTIVEDNKDPISTLRVEEQAHLNELREKKKQTEEQLNELEGKCGNCEKLLPTQCGFFFGSTDYDGLYFSKIEDCYEQMLFLLDHYDEDKETLFVLMSW